MPRQALLTAAALLCAASAQAPARARALQPPLQPPAAPTPQPLPLGAAPSQFQMSSGAAGYGVAYYSLTVPLPFTGLHVPLATGYGNCNLYASVQAPGAPWAAPGPNASDYASSSMLAAELIDVYPTDAPVARSCVRSYAGSTCTFVIAVACSAAASQYWLHAYVDGAWCAASPQCRAPAHPAPGPQ